MVSDIRTAERILRAADQLFFSLGYSRVSMDELAALLGMSKKTIYKYYHSKEILLTAVIENLSQEICDGLDAIFHDQSIDFTQKLDAFFEFMGARMNKIQNPHITSLQHLAPTVWERLQELRKITIADKFSLLLQAGKDEGLIKQDIHPGLVQLMMWGVLEKVVMPEHISALPFTTLEILKMSTQILLEGILVE